MIASFLLLMLGCWAHVPNEQLERERELIVVGEIVAIAAAPRPAGEESDCRKDTAWLAVGEVLKADGVAVSAGDELPLMMPAASNRIRWSTDLRYPVGASGVWLLTRGSGGWVAEYIRDLQPLAQKAEIVAVIAANRR